jgi:hypothetical protein
MWHKLELWNSCNTTNAVCFRCVIVNTRIKTIINNNNNELSCDSAWYCSLINPGRAHPLVARHHWYFLCLEVVWLAVLFVSDFCYEVQHKVVPLLRGRSWGKECRGPPG